MKKLLCIFTVALIFITFLTTEHYLANQNLDNDSKNFREMEGFPTDLTHINEANKDSLQNGSKEIYGVALTDSELQELRFREKLSLSSTVIKKAALNQQILNYAGMYIDQNAGMLNIGIVNGDASTKEKILSIFPHPERIKFFPAQFTESELNEKYELLNSIGQDLINQGVPLLDWGVSPKDNRVKVLLESGVEASKKEMLNSYVGEKYLLIEEGKSNVRLTDRTAKTRPVIAGVLIETDITGTLNTKCTSGFSAADKNGNKGMITAGHCGNVGENIYQPTVSAFGLDKLGPISTKSGSGSNADAAWVPFSDVAPKIYGNKSVNKKLSYIEGNIGDIVYKDGANTGTTSGQIECLDCTSYDPNTGATFYHQRYANAKGRGGDSGGPVYSYYYNWTLGKNELYAAGISSMSGQVTLSDGSVVERLYYSPIDSVISALNLSNVLME